MATFAQTQKGYRALWDKAQIAPAKRAIVNAAAAKIIARKTTYQVIEQATGVPWFSIGAIHYRESSCDFGTYLGNGQSLKRATTQVPANRGPFTGPDAFKLGAIDALKLQGFTGHKVDTIERVLFDDEEFNGEGYTFHNENSPYIWAGTTLEQPGLYDNDGHYVPGLQDPRCGVAAIIKAIAEQDAAVAAFCNRAPVSQAAPAPSGAPQKEPSPMATATPNNVSLPSLQTVEADVNVGLNIAEQVLPVLSVFPGFGPIAALLLTACKAVRAVEAVVDNGTVAAIAETAQHLTPGAPNSSVLSPAVG